MKPRSLVFAFSALWTALVLRAFAEQKPPTLHEVEIKRNIAYYTGADADKERNKLDVYSPKGAKDCPVVVFIHGGAWSFGDTDFFGLHAAMGRMFARHGIVAVVANYRLSPKVKHPEHVKDVARAFAWTVANIGRYGGRAENIFLCGHSAGGHLVSLLATDEKYLKAEKRSLKDIKGVMSISGVYEIPEKLFRDVFGTDAETHRQASPLTQVKEGCPPFLILYAEKDYPTCEAQSEKFAKALKTKKVAVRIQCIKERNHLDILGNAAKDDDVCGRELLDFIAR
jgi:acetyl esterase/lipase